MTETGEAALINAVDPETCPYCQHDGISRFGQTRNGIQRYRCKGCGKTFTPITGTIFDSHKISISEWMEYCLNIFRYVSINADSWNNRNAFTTSRYWLEKLFLVLEHYTEDIIHTCQVNPANGQWGEAARDNRCKVLALYSSRLQLWGY